jgi:hypothetical protein
MTNALRIGCWFRFVAVIGVVFFHTVASADDDKNAGRIKPYAENGAVGLDLSDATGTFDVTWISVAMGITTQTSAAGGYRPMKKTIQGGSVVTFAAPYKGGWVAAIVKK